MILMFGERSRTLTSFTTLNALVYPAYAKLTFTRAFDKPYPLPVVPENESLKLALGFLTRVCPPRTARPVMLILKADKLRGRLHCSETLTRAELRF